MSLDFSYLLVFLSKCLASLVLIWAADEHERKYAFIIKKKKKQNSLFSVCGKSVTTVRGRQGANTFPRWNTEMSYLPVGEGLNEVFFLFRVTARLAVWSAAIGACNQTSYSRPSGKSERGPLLIKVPMTHKNPSPEGLPTTVAAQLLSFLRKHARVELILPVSLGD